MTSLRGRLLAWLIGLLTAVGVLAGVAAYVLDRNEVDASLDGQLRQIALNTGDTRPPKSGNGGGVSIEREDAFVVTIWDGPGAGTSSDPTVGLPRPTATGFTDLRGGGQAWRAYSLVAGDRVVQVAQRMVVREEFAAASALRAVLPFLALLPLSWILVGWVVGRVLRPIGSITAELRRRDHVNAAGPLPLAGMPDEILPLVLATNELIGRLHAQLEFRQRFISDAAHELRTPLTAVRLQASNLRHQVNGADAEMLLAEMERGLRRMSEMIGQMLDLARAEAPAALRPVAPVELRDTIALALQDVIGLANERGIDIGLASSAAAVVMADAEDLRTLLRNLLDNAIRYTPVGGTVDVDLGLDGGQVVLEVRDTGPGVPEALLDRVFDRFFRAATAEIDGNGLGLSIVRAIANRSGATVDLRNRSDRSGLVARVTFRVAGDLRRKPPALALPPASAWIGDKSETQAAP